MNTEGSAPLPSTVGRRLHAVLGPRGMVTQPDRLLPYESDALATVRGQPRAALFPRTEDELAAVVETLHQASIPFVPRGSGTGLSGGAVARGAVLVCTNRMDRILELDPEARRAVVEPGVITADISRAAASHGLRYLPDPASATACTIGGNVAENAGGPHCLKHGVTTDHVLGLRLVLPDGRRARLRRGEDGGLDLTGLVVGSEGTLGVVSRVSVRLVPRPEAVRTALGFFDEIGDAGRAVTGILEAGVVPVALELVDGATLRVVERSQFAAGLPTDVGAALLVECEGFPAETEAEIGRAVQALRAGGARSVEVATEEAARQQLWHARKKAYGVLGRLAPDIFVQDAAVPRSTLPDLLPRIEEVAERHGVRLVNFFHAGDGNLHPNLIFDRRDPDQVERVEAAGAEIMEMCVEAGGTITGEHGVGLDKKRYMNLIYGPEELRAFQRLKRVFDPKRLCNPDKMLPEVGEDPPPGGVESVHERSPGIRHHAEDLMITASGEASVGELVEAAAGNGQWLPPAAGARELTVDELVARNPAGPYEATYGSLGRHLLSVRMEAPDGRRYAWGRRVVKNVAGYDLPRLICGHAGRLGRVLEATLRLWPDAETRRIFRVTPGLRALEALTGVEAGGAFRPDGALWSGAPGAAGELRLELSGPNGGVAERAGRLEIWARTRDLELSVVEPEGARLRTSRGDAPGATSPLLLRACPGDPYLARAVRKLGTQAGDAGIGVLGVEAFPGTGRLRVHLEGDGEGTGTAPAKRTAGLLALLPGVDWRLEQGPDAARRILRERRDGPVLELEAGVVEALGGDPADGRGEPGRPSAGQARDQEEPEAT